MFPLRSPLGKFVSNERKSSRCLIFCPNAVKFTPEGGRFGINARQTDGTVENSVSDTGIRNRSGGQPGILEEFRQ